MQRQVDSRLFLLVEGDDEDAILFDHVNGHEVGVLVLGGKPNVLATAEIVARYPLPGVFALVDRDLDRLAVNSGAYPPGLVATDGYDLVADLIALRPELFRRAARVHGKAAYDSIIESWGDFLTLCYKVCLSLAALRLINLEHSLGLNLRNFPVSSVINADLSPKELPVFIKVANDRSKTQVNPLSAAQLLSEATDRIQGDVRLCGGHDLMAAAAAMLRKNGANSVSANNLAASFITGIDCEAVGELSLVEDLCDWADGHSRVAFRCPWSAYEAAYGERFGIEE